MHYLLGIHNNWWKWSDIAYTYKAKSFLRIHFEEVGNLVLVKIYGFLYIHENVNYADMCGKEIDLGSRGNARALN
jgi:hypothetical protein